LPSGEPIPTDQVEDRESTATQTVAREWIPMEPVRLEEYTLVARLGQGGMAEIYLAVHHGLSNFRKLVVVKRLLPHLAVDEDAVRMFLDEARLAARLDHPRVVQTTKVGASNGVYYMAMEFLDGQPFNRVLRRAAKAGKRIPPALTVRIVSDALEGLHYAHTAKDFDGTPLNVVHRDVSPHNLYVTYDGAVKLLDFGIAKAELQEARTKTGLIKGKFAYIAPEQALGDELDGRADVWSTGVMLWEALACQRLFKARSEVATLHESLNKAIPSLCELQDDVPEELDVIVRRALQRDPETRWSSAKAMRDALEEWLLGRSSSGTQEQVSLFLKDLFAEEHARERKHLKKLTKISSADRESLEVMSTGSFAAYVPGGTPSQTTQSAVTGSQVVEVERKRSWPQLALLVLVVAMAAVIAYLAGEREPERAESQPEEIAEGMRAEGPETGTTSAAGTASQMELGAASGMASGSQVELGPSESAMGMASEMSSSETAMGMASEMSSSETTEDSEMTVATSMTRMWRPRMRPTMTMAPAETEPVMREEPAMTAEQAFGFLTLDTDPWSHVSLGGRRLGTTPLVRVRLPAGEHMLVLSNPELDVRTRFRVTIRDGETYTRRIGLE